MKNKKILILTSAVLFLVMLATTIWASMQQNLFTEFTWTGSPMWFKATLVDFYINQFFLWLWVVYLEDKHLPKFIWLVLFFCFGSMGTAAYIIYKVLTNKSLKLRELA